MAYSLIYYLSIVSIIILQIIDYTVCKTIDIQQGFTTRCDDLCSQYDLLLQNDLRPDCQRGCQYFNLDFIISANNRNKLTDVKTVQGQCQISCIEAYSINIKKDACFLGCKKMRELQEKAPYINGWLVYMGTSDRNMVLLQPDLDIPSEDDWVLLDSVFRSNDNEKYFEQFKLTETHIQTIPTYPVRSRLTINYCVPTWMWIIPITLILIFIWLHYANYIYTVTMHETHLHTNDSCSGVNNNDNNIKNNNNGNGGDDSADVDINLINNKKSYDHFIVSTDTYFYPTPAIPPPKYNAVNEALLASSDEELVPMTNNK